jgi:hypothetical protein
MRKLGTLVGLTAFALAGLAHAQGEALGPAPAPAPAAEPAPAPAAEPAAVAPVPAVQPTAVAPAEAAPASGRLIIGADVAFQLPLGNFSDATGMGFGALARGEFKIIPKLNLTARTGFVYSLSKNDFSVSNIPFWVGGKYFITDMFYGAAEIGENIFLVRTNFGYFGSSSYTDENFGATVGAGVSIGKLDVRAQLEVLDLANASDSLAIMVNVGFNFAQLM